MYMVSLHEKLQGLEPCPVNVGDVDETWSQMEEFNFMTLMIWLDIESLHVLTVGILKEV